ncbi:hypothetical protein CWI42_010010 [Ordospora colligata]|uniref:Uncharacterized protein n=1 Tax=Ordospora colligata OC4 TaxID=1354746 RepID=A0A0B2UN19_9MICR|nr:uncharacterized protein M896_010010 [Ordospora colligata OC4]KHN70350.1 hypothetical protein M896_010010 [Ordospora colligata OC4]TBU17100.1 hypothetical protein CWI41_010010 [Ordospora colligata]TBU17350.1 hypothetical protein CWI40_010010 [Ordospora colligata]TBU19530.1 hypothetical protein CWI42_010010 [Ordospora colligata]
MEDSNRNDEDFITFYEILKFNNTGISQNIIQNKDEKYKIEEEASNEYSQLELQSIIDEKEQIKGKMQKLKITIDEALKNRTGYGIRIFFANLEAYVNLLPYRLLDLKLLSKKFDNGPVELAPEHNNIYISQIIEANNTQSNESETFTWKDGKLINTPLEYKEFLNAYINLLVTPYSREELNINITDDTLLLFMKSPIIDKSIYLYICNDLLCVNIPES